MDTELPKRLYKEGTEPQVDKINKCAKMSILKVLKKHMEDELNEVKKDPVFAHILAIYDNRLAFSAKLVHSFMSRRLLTSKKHELWFVFARRPLRFSLQEFHAVTGLKCQDDGNYELEKWDDDGGFWSKLIKRKGKISMTTIREEHVLQAHKWSRLDRLRLVYLCVIAGVLLAVDEKTEISHKYIKLIMEFKNVREYPWGLHSFDHLVEGVIKAELWKPKSYVLEGFSYALQIWIMEAIPDCGVLLGKKLDKGSIVSPRCSNWTGAGRPGYNEINNLEKAFGSEGVLYPAISSTGNMDVLESVDFSRDDDMRDERVDRMKALIFHSNDWSNHIWDFEEEFIPATPPPKPTSETGEGESSNDVDIYKTPCGEPTAASGLKKGKRKAVDYGAERRKKQLLYERAAGKRAATDQDTNALWCGLFDDFKAKIVSENDAKNDKLEKEVSELKNEVSELKDMLREALTQKKSEEQPPTSSKPPSQRKTSSQPPLSQRKTRQQSTTSKPASVTHSQPRGKVNQTNLEDNIDLTQDSVTNLEDNMQAFLLQKISNLSKDAKVPGFDPSQRQTKEHPQPQGQTNNIDIKAEKLLDINLTQSSVFNMEENTEEYLQRKFGDLTQDSFVPGFDLTQLQVQEDALEFQTPITELHPVNINLSEKVPSSFAKELRVDPIAGGKGPDHLLVYVSDESWEELEEWSRMPEDLQIGPSKFTSELSKRVMGSFEWLHNQEIDAMMYLFRERTSLKRWNVDRVGFMSYSFSTSIKAAYAKWKSNKRQFELEEILIAYGKGELPAHGRTNKVWDVDIDRIYVPVCVSGCHWISLCIDFVHRTVEVFDCAGMKKYREVEAFSVMVPRIVKEAQTDSKKRQLLVAPYTVRYAPVRKDLNKTNTHCGIYALKHIECHVLGLPLSLVNDDNIKEARQKVATDLLQAARDEVLVERMTKYIPPKFTSSEVVDISGP